MVRFKFLLFALLVLGLGALHLPRVSEPLSARATEDAAAHNEAALSEVARVLEARRLAVQSLALTLASQAELAVAVQPRVVPLPKGKGIRIEEPPTAERFAGLRAAALPLVPEPLKDSVVLGLATAEDTLYARGAGEPLADNALDVRALLQAGSAGLRTEAFGAPYLFYSVPVLWNPEGGRAELAATFVVGAPLELDPKALEAAAVSSGVAALKVMRGETVLGAVGTDPALADAGFQALRPGQVGHAVVERGGVRGFLDQLPRVKLPLLTHPGDFQGGEAPLAVGSRRTLDGDFEVVAVSSTRPFMVALANYQHDALFGLLGLLGVSLVWLLVMGGSRGAAAEVPARKKKGQKDEPAEVDPGAQAAATLPLAPVQEPPVPGPEDFPFPAAPPVAAAEPEADPFPAAPAPVDNPFAALPVPAEDAYPFPAAPAPVDNPFAAPPVPAGDAYPFASPAEPVRDPFDSPTVPGKDPFASRLPADAYPFPSGDVGVASSARGAFAFEDQPTAAYSLKQAANPFAAAAAQAGLPASDFGEEPSPEPTRVATIPRELLERAARPSTAEIPLPGMRPSGFPGVAGPSLAPTPVMGTPMPHLLGLLPPPAPVPSSGAGAVALTEEQHFQDVFREFVVTRDHCGEPNDGLTYDKFVAKLRKNKEQLVQKYACKTVRFQVYVKEGKAALKATPVKE